MSGELRVASCERVIESCELREIIKATSGSDFWLLGVRLRTAVARIGSPATGALCVLTTNHLKLTTQTNYPRSDSNRRPSV